jgi:hypothetical protein
MGAVAIMSGRALSKRTAVLTVIGAMLVSDFVLSITYGYPLLSSISLFVYGAFLMQALIGRLLRNPKGGTLIAAFTGACIFFLVTNFGVWLQGMLYPRTIEGLMQCYVMALPFFKMTLLGNMIWTPILSLAHKAYKRRFEPSVKSLPAV